MTDNPSERFLELEWKGGVHTEAAFISPPALAHKLAQNPYTVAGLLLGLAHSINRGIGGNAEESMELLRETLSERSGWECAHRDKVVLRDLCADILAAIGDTSIAPAALSAALGPTPAAVEVTVTAPAGKRALVSVIRGDKSRQGWTVTEGQAQTWSCIGQEMISVSEEPTRTVAHKRDNG